MALFAHSGQSVAGRSSKSAASSAGTASTTPVTIGKSLLQA
jgi:hypothetical protein